MEEQGHLLHELRRIASECGPCPGSAGRGLVICAGGPILLTNAFILVKLLRNELACTLPIEIWHCGASEMPGLLARKLEELGCSVIDASLVTDASGIRDGWQLKIHAVRYSGFAEVLLLDADQIPVADPAIVFSWQQFAETGALFWPDRVDFAESNPVWELLGLPARRTISFESGQLCINKCRHWRTLALAAAMAAEPKVFLERVYGDKDIFLLAWLADGAIHAVVPHRPFLGERYLGQRDFSGDLLFQHRSNCKFSLTEAPFRPQGFRFQGEAENYLAELESIWNGRNFQPPPRTAAAHTMEYRLVAQRDFELEFRREKISPLQLLDGHQIGVGRDYHITNWHVDVHNERYRLWLHGHTRSSYLLESDDGEIWRGRGLGKLAEEVIVAPASSSLHSGFEGGRSLTDEFIDVAGMDSEALGAALRLLGRIEPGVEKAILRRADREKDAAKADFLRCVAAEIPRSSMTLAPPSISNILWDRIHYEADY